MPERKFTAPQHCILASLWFAYNAQWNALLPVVLPAQVAAIGGQAHKELLNGIALAAGALVALITTPIAGALSDRSRNPRGRRRPFLVQGILLNLAFLAALGAIGSRGGMAAFITALLGLQFASNWWGGPYAGMIPDIAPRDEQGRASGYMMLMTGAGAIVGTGLAGPLITGGGFWGAYSFLILTLLLCGILTISSVREPSPEKRTSEPGPMFVDFFPEPAEHHDFYLVLITRAFVTMGTFSILPFFQYFFTEVMHDPNAVFDGSVLMGCAALVTLPVSLLAGKKADRQGPKRIVWISGWIMAACAAIYIVDCFIPSWPFTIVMALIFAAGSIAYQAVDWALALKVLPDARYPGKDMGIWHIAFVLPQTIAPAITGVLLDRTKKFSEPGAYALVFAMTALWFALGTAPIRRLRRG